MFTTYLNNVFAAAHRSPWITKTNAYYHATGWAAFHIIMPIFFTEKFIVRITGFDDKQPNFLVGILVVIFLILILFWWYYRMHRVVSALAAWDDKPKREKVKWSIISGAVPFLWIFAIWLID